MLYAKFGWNWPTRFGEDKMLKVYANDDNALNDYNKDGLRTNFDQKTLLEPLAQAA